MADVTQVPQLLHGGETRVWGDAGYQGVARRPEHRGRAMDWQIALRAGRRRQLAPGSAAARMERRKAAMRAKVELRSGHFGTRYRGLAKPEPALPVVWAGEARGARHARRESCALMAPKAT